LLKMKVVFIPKPVRIIYSGPTIIDV
jgi:hypothetical protein